MTEQSATGSERSSEVFDGLEVGDRVAYEHHSLLGGPERKEGEIVEVDREGQTPTGQYVFDRYKVDREDGWGWTTGRKVVEVLDDAE